MIRSIEKVRFYLAAITLIAVCCFSTALHASESSDKIVLQDILGREVVLEGPAQKIVLTFNFEEYFAVAGEEGISNIAGWARSYWEGRRQSTWDVFTEKYPELKNIPDVGYVPKNTLNAEMIISLTPDLVLMPRNDYENVKTDLERLEAAKIPVIFIDFHLQTMENHCNSILLIGKAIGKESRAEEIVAFYKEQSDKVTELLAKLEDSAPRPKVYMEFSEAAGPEAFGATYGKQMWGALIYQCGGDNIARELVKGANGTIAPEQILAADPDIVIFAGNQFANSNVNIGLGYTSDEGTALKNLISYAHRPGWEDLNAVKNKKMYALYHDLSRHIFDVAGLQFFAKAIHPEVFQDLDPNETLKEFHERFYPVEYTGVWMISWSE